MWGVKFLKGNFDQLFKALALQPKRKQKTKETRKERALRINAKYPGSERKPDREASKLYAFKGGNPRHLKILRESVETGNMTLEEALLQLRGFTPKSVEPEQEIVPSLRDRLQDIRERKESQKTFRTNSRIEDGFLYLITNPSHPGWIKVGQTSDYEARLSTYQTASPHADYCMIAIRYVEDRRQAEAKFLELAKIVFEVKGEWIKASADELLANF